MHYVLQFFLQPRGRKTKENKHEESMLMYWYPVSVSNPCRITVRIISVYHILSLCTRVLVY